MSFAPIGYDVASRIVRPTSTSVSSVIIVSMREMVDTGARRARKIEEHVSRVDHAALTTHATVPKWPEHSHDRGVPMRLKDKVVVITGAGLSLGHDARARLLAFRGRQDHRDRYRRHAREDGRRRDPGCGRRGHVPEGRRHQRGRHGSRGARRSTLRRWSRVMYCNARCPRGFGQVPFVDTTLESFSTRSSRWNLRACSSAPRRRRTSSIAQGGGGGIGCHLGGGSGRLSGFRATSRPRPARRPGTWAVGWSSGSSGSGFNALCPFHGMSANFARCGRRRPTRGQS